jgi:hypothetical protein
LTIARDPAAVTGQSREFVVALEQVTWRNFPIVTAFTYNELQNSGRMVLISDERLRRALADYYSYMGDTAELGFAEPKGNRFDALTSGLLTGDQLSAIEDPEQFPIEILTEDALGIAMDFATRTEAHGWLARHQQYEVLMRTRAGEFIDRAEILVARIDSLMNR